MSKDFVVPNKFDLMVGGYIDISRKSKSFIGLSCKSLIGYFAIKCVSNSSTDRVRMIKSSKHDNMRSCINLINLS